MARLIWRLSVFVMALVPLAWWLEQGVTGHLGPDPGKVLVDRLGLGALYLLLITLAMTPLGRVTGWSGWVLVRRQLGLWSFSYAVLHVLGYGSFLIGFSAARLFNDLGERPYIIVGAIAFLLLTVLALTSNRYSIRSLGRRWRLLHRATYIALLLALVHMLWIVRSDIGEWLLYAVLGALLMFMRIPVVSKAMAFRKNHREKG